MTRKIFRRMVVAQRAADAFQPTDWMNPSPAWKAGRRAGLRGDALQVAAWAAWAAAWRGGAVNGPLTRHRAGI